MIPNLAGAFVQHDPATPGTWRRGGVSGGADGATTTLPDWPLRRLHWMLQAGGVTTARNLDFTPYADGIPRCFLDQWNSAEIS